VDHVVNTPNHRQSAAAPSPFPPIAEYGFLSNCHTGALIAADGSIDWLCIPSFDSASIFGSLLDRQAGSMRIAPFGITHPVARAYVAGTNVMITTWRTPTGWLEVRDALTIGPRDHEDEITPHTRPPADDDGDHMLVRTVAEILASASSTVFGAASSSAHESAQYARSPAFSVCLPRARVPSMPSSRLE